MKKIFAIALALVMVLSMASAFASPCTAGFDWTCATTDTDCGKATVEVVPYVKTNAACNGSEFVESDCAAAINGENVYYALKMTVDKDIDLEWLKKVTVELSVKGMEKKDWTETFKGFKLNADDSEDGWVLYLSKDRTQWVDATEIEDFDIDTVIHKSVVKEYAKAKVCLTLKSESDGAAGTVGDYYVVYNKAVEAKAATKAVVKLNVTGSKVAFTPKSGWTVTEQTKSSVVLTATKAGVKNIDAKTAVAKDFVNITSGTFTVDKIVNGKDEVKAADATIVVYNKLGGDVLVVYTIADGKIYDINYTAICGEAAYSVIKAFFGLDIGTCVDADLIKANFGWKEKVESCYSWKTENATAIVDNECVVAIPKTGDASVLAWLF